MLVAAPDPRTLEEALAAIKPRIDAQPANFDMELSDHAFKTIRIAKGDVDAAFANADANGHLVVEGTYHTDSQEQLYIEPQGCIAWPPDDAGVITVKGSLQCPHYVRKALMRCFGVEADKARVVQMETGGGFGGKEEYPSVIACHAALLARKTGVPVRMIYDRHEDLAVTPKRHPSRVRTRALVDRTGLLIALDVDVLLDGGAYTTLSPVVLSRGCIHAAGPYRCANTRIHGRVVRTNHVPYGAFRGFRRAADVLRDRARHGSRCEVGERPPLRAPAPEHAAPRRHDRYRTGAEGQRRQRGSARRRRDDERLRQAPVVQDGRRRRAAGRAAGLSFFYHGAGFTGSGEEMLKGRVRVGVLDDGRVEVLAGSTEIGQGTNALFLALAAEALGTSTDDVVVATPDTAHVPDSGPTGRIAHVHGRGRLLDESVRGSRRARRRRGANSVRERALSFKKGGGECTVTVQYSSPKDIVWNDDSYEGDAYPVFGWAADVAEIEVDLVTLEIEVKRFHTAVDVGKAIQPALVEGQIQGRIAASRRLVAPRSRVDARRPLRAGSAGDVHHPDDARHAAFRRDDRGSPLRRTDLSARKASASCRWTAARPAVAFRDRGCALDPRRARAGDARTPHGSARVAPRRAQR
jgi:CO/xanthine dehydrogenase Mo-binding subunit